jgi:hypothetical protein
MMEDDSSDDERTARGAKFKKRRVVGIDHLDDLGEWRVRILSSPLLTLILSSGKFRDHGFPSILHQRSPWC